MSHALWLPFLLSVTCSTVASLRCSTCQYHSDLQEKDQFCDATVQECNSMMNETFCAVANVSINGRFGIRKGCAGNKLCKDPALECALSVKERGYTWCQVVCCTDDLCNTVKESIPITDQTKTGTTELDNDFIITDSLGSAIPRPTSKSSSLQQVFNVFYMVFITSVVFACL